MLRAIVRAWRPSLFAGFMGALASQFWFLAFALATAASVRTLALVEVLFAQAISRFVFKQATTAREALGIVLIVVGVSCCCGRIDLASVPPIHLSKDIPGHTLHPVFDGLCPAMTISAQFRSSGSTGSGWNSMPSSCSSLASSRRGFAVDRAVLDLAVVHLARFFGKFLADIVGVLGEVVAQFLELGAELALLRRHHRDRRAVSPAPVPAPARSGGFGTARRGLRALLGAATAAAP